MGPGPDPVRPQGPVHQAAGPGPYLHGAGPTISGPDPRTSLWGPVRSEVRKGQDRTADSLSTTPRLKYASKASNPGEASKLPSTFQAQVASVKPTTSKKTNLSKREAEQDLIKDGPAKRVKTNGSKKVERQAKGQGDHPPPAVYASELPKSSKHSKSSKLSEASKPSKPDDKKRNPVEEQELGAESSGQTKGLEKTDSAINAPQPMPTTPKSVN